MKNKQKGILRLLVGLVGSYVAAVGPVLAEEDFGAKAVSAGSGAFHLQSAQGILRLDVRARPAGERFEGARSSRLDTMAEEAEVVASFGNRQEEQFLLALQVPLHSLMEGRAYEMHFSNAYGIIKFGVGKPVVRAGQFVLPFGNLTDYETHTRILQTLYPRSLGLRLDRGVSVEGPVEKFDFWLAAMNGNGPRGDNNSNKVVVLKVAREWETAAGPLRVGLSVASGRMPVFPSMEHDMPMDVEPLGFPRKFRVAMDSESYVGLTGVRSEWVWGCDAGLGSVDGQYLLLERPLSYRQEVACQLDRWHQFDGTSYGLGLQWQYTFDGFRRLRIAWRSRRSQMKQGMEQGRDRSMDSLEVQYLQEWTALIK